MPTTAGSAADPDPTPVVARRWRPANRSASSAARKASSSGRRPRLKNPHKWTKYSLEDVDTSDRSNTAAAFSFLREIESQKRDQQQHEDEEGPTEFKSKVRFNRSVKLQARLEEVDKPPPTEEDKPKVKGCKVVMPEYVVGQKPKKSRPVKVGGGAAGGGSSKRDRSSELKLDHLMEEEDDEEDDNDGMD
ncbi:uncharacterized protein LOC6030977 isoform X2 [Culex quinquefasciatus]|uniref:uncharacterized protein LOC6030977 isoform X2 n=1 Tax=Culex quinquefasciatus TaxID=7176 RepID=UPI0018E3D979|nr:uncharacterized protein LOC6030977 isoform X2 [Culex quinquefasciatus]